LARSNIFLGNEAAAEAMINELIADYNDQPDLPRAVFKIGEEYYNKAFNTKGDPNSPDAKPEEYYRKALAVWERIIKELPDPNSTIAAHAYYFSAVCYRRLGRCEKAIEYYQKIVDNWPDYEYAWNALFLIGRSYEDLKESGVISKSQADPKIKAAYEQLLEKYPDCPAAKIAQRWLNRHNTSK